MLNLIVTVVDVGVQLQLQFFNMVICDLLMSVVFFDHILTDIGYIVVVLDRGYSIQVFLGKKIKNFIYNGNQKLQFQKKKKQVYGGGSKTDTIAMAVSPTATITLTIDIAATNGRILSFFGKNCYVVFFPPLHRDIHSPSLGPPLQAFTKIFTMSILADHH